LSLLILLLLILIPTVLLLIFILFILLLLILLLIFISATAFVIFQFRHGHHQIVFGVHIFWVQLERSLKRFHTFFIFFLLIPGITDIVVSFRFNIGIGTEIRSNLIQFFRLIQLI